MKSMIALVLLCIILAVPVLVAQQPPDPAGRIALRDGIVIDPARNLAYVMTNNGVSAVDLTTGKTGWTSTEAAKPLALVGDRLLNQAEPTSGEATRKLQLVTVNVAAPDAPVVRGEVELPARVRSTVGETLAGTFAARARPLDGNAIVTWDFAPAPRKGMPPRSATATPGSPAPPAPAPPSSGTLHVNLSTGQVTKLANPDLPASFSPNRATPPAAMIPTEKSSQFVSADGRHVLITERVADDRVWDRYRWTIHEQTTGNRIGEIRTHISFSPFIVRDSMVIFETTPYARAGEALQPAKLRGIHLESGKEIWSIAVREVVWRGPVPP